MRASSTVALAHRYWEDLLDPSDTAIDATCGNGKDTLKLAQLLPKGHVIALDIQQKAIEKSSLFLKNHLPSEALERISLFHQSHTDFPPIVYTYKIKLIIYNLGYLPGGGDKKITTQQVTTLESIKKSFNLLTPGGALSIICYPGHPEGAREEESLLEEARALDPLLWTVCYHQWLNHYHAPSLLLIKKR
jgi:tRNA1(Val) A37 N6-methylase TrmN6